MTTVPDQQCRRRVLHVTRNLPPLRGGMERLNKHIALELAHDFEVAVVGPRGCRQELPNEIAAFEVPAAPLWRFVPAAIIATARAARRLRPHVVFAGSGLAAPIAWCAARLSGARLVVYVHGLDIVVPSRAYRWFWLPFLRRADLCIANSRYTASLAEAADVDAARLAIVHPGVSLPGGQPADAGVFRERFGIGKRPLLLSVGRLIARKGLLEFVENALPAIASEYPDVCVLVLGDETPALLHGNSIGLGRRVRDRAAALGVESNLLFVGPQDDQTLAAAYAAADVHVFPVREVPGDVEGFGMVAIEAAAHGLPTVAFAVGGVIDAVDHGVSGTLVPAGDYVAFVQAVGQVIEHRCDSGPRNSARAFAAHFAWPIFGDALRSALQRSLCAEATA